MALSDRGYFGSSTFGPRSGLAVKWLVIVNVAVYVPYFFLALFTNNDGILSWLELTPALVVRFGAVWQLVTYQFLHSVSDPFHIIFNMLALWLLGQQIEAVWGWKRFLQFYLLCGVGAGLCIIVMAYAIGTPNMPIIGASGAIFGVMIAAATIYPDMQMLFFFLFPIKLKYFVIIFAVVSLLLLLRQPNSGTHVAHLGGMLAGWAYLKYYRISEGAPTGRSQSRGKRGGPQNPVIWVREQYQAWKFNRAKRKFEVYMNRRDRDRLH